MAKLQATATGSLSKTPLTHLLLYCRERQLSGTLCLWRAGSRPEGLGDDQVYVERGMVLAAATEEPAMDLRDALSPLCCRPNGVFAFYEAHRILPSAGHVTEGELHPFSLLAAALRGPYREDLVAAALTGLEHQPVQVKPGMPLSEFRFTREEDELVQYLLIRPATPQELLSRGQPSANVVRRVIYALRVARCLSVLPRAGRQHSGTIEVPEAPPLVSERVNMPRRPTPSIPIRTFEARRPSVLPTVIGVSAPISDPPSDQATLLTHLPPPIPVSDAPASAASEAQARAGSPATLPEGLPLMPEGLSGLLARPDAEPNSTLLDAEPEPRLATDPRAAIPPPPLALPDIPEPEDVASQPEKAEPDGELAADADDLADLPAGARPSPPKVSGIEGLLAQTRTRATSQSLPAVPRSQPPRDGQREDRAHAAFVAGEQALKRQQYPEAVKRLTRAYKLAPDQANYLATLALARFELAGRQPRAAKGTVRLLERAISANPGCERAHHYLGVVLKQVGHADAAAHHFELAFNLNPHNLEAAREVRLHAIRARKASGGIINRLIQSLAPPRKR